MKKTTVIISTMIALVLLLSACSLKGGDETDLKGSAWALVSLNGSLPVSGTNITLSFEKDTLGGNGGCNSYGGEFKVRGEKLTPSSIYSTEMYCEAAGIMDQEALYFDLLSKVETFLIGGEELILTTSDGQSLVFHRLGL